MMVQHISSKTHSIIVSMTVNVRSTQVTRNLFRHSGKESQMILEQYSAGQTVRHISSRITTTTGLISLAVQWMMGIRVQYQEPGEELCTRQILSNV